MGYAVNNTGVRTVVVFKQPHPVRLAPGQPRFRPRFSNVKVY